MTPQDMSKRLLAPSWPVRTGPGSAAHDRHATWALDGGMTLWPALLAAACVAACAAGLLLPLPLAKAWTHEGGPVETLTVVGYALCLALAVWQGGVALLRRHPMPFALVLLLMARELDADKRFLAQGVLKARLYTDPALPWRHKLIGALVLLLVATLLVRMARRYARLWWQGLREGDTASVAVLLAGALVVVSKTLDGLGRKLADLGIVLSDLASSRAGVVEEVLELGIPLALALGVLAWGRTHRPAATAARRSPR